MAWSDLEWPVIVARHGGGARWAGPRVCNSSSIIHHPWPMIRRLQRTALSSVPREADEEGKDRGVHSLIHGKRISKTYNSKSGSGGSPPVRGRTREGPTAPRRTRSGPSEGQGDGGRHEGTHESSRQPALTHRDKTTGNGHGKLHIRVTGPKKTSGIKDAQNTKPREVRSTSRHASS